MNEAIIPTDTQARSNDIKRAYLIYSLGDHTTNYQPVRSPAALAKLTGVSESHLHKVIKRDKWEEFNSRQLIASHQETGNSLPHFDSEIKLLNSEQDIALKQLSEMKTTDPEYKGLLDIVERLSKLTGLAKRVEVEAKVEAKQREMLAQEKVKKFKEENGEGALIEIT